MDGLLGVAGMIITSDEMDHSLKFPTFSTSKFVGVQRFTNLAITGAPQNSSPGIAAALTMWALPGWKPESTLPAVKPGWFHGDTKGTEVFLLEKAWTMKMIWFVGIEQNIKNEDDMHNFGNIIGIS